ncbi:hypothetical protein [Shewanella algae]|uniref:hypothetical protein n=1 Tax=Shewanella algae TaxID=38313 RepID=UPI001BEDB571|nr:hypothetical protein [Shewanella algae]BCV28936.1 hypothetical protein TUM3811_27960 [Shewanella algae]
MLTPLFLTSKGINVNLNLGKVIRNRKDCYATKEYDEVLLSRHLAGNIKSVIKRAKSRNQISRELVQHLKEGTSYRVYRLDIEKFFEKN